MTMIGSLKSGLDDIALCSRLDSCTQYSVLVAITFALLGNTLSDDNSGYGCSRNSPYAMRQLLRAGKLPVVSTYIHGRLVFVLQNDELNK